MNLIRKVIFDIKTYVSINHFNKKRFVHSKVFSYIPKTLLIGDYSTIREKCYFSNKLKYIGKGSYIGIRTEILNCSSIGNYSSISHDVKIGLDNHLLSGISTSPILCDLQLNEPCEIGSDVLISANVVIMSGVKIGTGAVIGANSFVNKDVPPYSIVVGSPARIIKYRFDEEKIELILKSKWWERNHHTLIKHKPFSGDVESFLKSIQNQI